MRNASMEQINQQYFEEGEIDLCRCFKIIAERKKTFFAVFLLVMAVGVWSFLSYSKTYRISVLLQSPTFGEVLNGGDGLKLSQDLKGLIISDYFKQAIKKRLNLDLGKNHMDFSVEIPDKTNALQVNVELTSKEKESGIVILQNLAELISESHAHLVEFGAINIARQTGIIKLAIASSKEKAKKLQEQIREVTVREVGLNQEKILINMSSTQISEKREGLLKASEATEGADTLLLANQIQNNSSYLKWVDKQLVELSVRKGRLNFELEVINSQVSNLQKKIDSLNIRENYIPSLKIVAQPEIFPSPIASKRKKALGLFLVIGLFSGVLAVFLQESRKGRHKDG